MDAGVCVCGLHVLITNAHRTLPVHPLLFTASLLSHTQLLQARLQTKKEREKCCLTFFLLFFFFPLLSPPRRLNRGTSAGPQFFGGDYEKQLHKPPSAAHSRAEEKKSFASREEKEQKPSDARAVLNRCLPNCKGIVWLCVVAGREEAGGRGDGKRPPSHAGWGRPPATPI